MPTNSIPYTVRLHLVKIEQIVMWIQNQRFRSTSDLTYPNLPLFRASLELKPTQPWQTNTWSFSSRIMSCPRELTRYCLSLHWKFIFSTNRHSQNCSIIICVFLFHFIPVDRCCRREVCKLVTAVKLVNCHHYHRSCHSNKWSWEIIQGNQANDRYGWTRQTYHIFRGFSSRLVVERRSRNKS